MKVSFDPINKIISVIETPVNGQVFIDVKTDIYSDGKELWITDDNLTKFRFPVRAVGGDPLPGSKSLGSTFFLLYGWKIRPFEANHTLNINGNLYCEDGSSPYASTIGTFNIMLISSVSSLVDSTIQQLPEIEYASFNGGVTIDVENGTAGTNYPQGTPISPVNNLIDAQTIAATRGFSKFLIKNTLTLQSADDISGFTLVGEDKDSTNLILMPGCITTAANLHDLSISGTCGGRMNLHNCHVSNIVGLCASGGNANITACHLMGSIQLRALADQTFNFVNCIGADNDFSPTLDVNGCIANVHFTGFSGVLTLANVTNANQNIGLDLNSAKIILNDSITQGIIALRGIARLYNNSVAQPGLTIDTTGLLAPEMIEHMTFDGLVHIDVSRGGLAACTGIYGTHRFPCDNFADAKEIAIARGFSGFHLVGNLTIGSNESANGYFFKGIGVEDSKITLTAGCTTSKATFKDMSVTGFQDGETHYEGCEILSLGGVHCKFEDCLLTGPMTMEEGSYADTTVIVSCYTGWFKNAISPALKDEFVVDLNNSSINMAFNNFYGKIKFINLNRATTPGTILLNIGAGKVTIDSSCTMGQIKIRGNAEVINNSNGTIVDDDTTMNLVWLADPSVYPSGSIGKKINDIPDENISVF